eukprot:840996-Pelagomonas_calceolata.AAC.1
MVPRQGILLETWRCRKEKLCSKRRKDNSHFETQGKVTSLYPPASAGEQKQDLQKRSHLSKCMTYRLYSTRRALEKTPLTSRHQDQARATASHPPDPH